MDFDEKRKLVGEILANDNTYAIMKFTSTKPRYLGEIAHYLNIQGNLVMHHLNKLKKLGVLEIQEKKRKSTHVKDSKFFNTNIDFLNEVDIIIEKDYI